MDNFYTYIYSDPSKNNEPFYVGKGTGTRLWSHLNRKDRHPVSNKIKSLYSKGVKPMISVYSGLDEEFAFFLEEELISKFGRKDLKTGCLLNLTNGGEGSSGRIATAQLRKNMSAAKSGQKYSDEARKNMSKGQIGRVLTEERNKKISEKLLGHAVSEETKEKLSAKAKIRHIGEGNPMAGKKHSPEAIAKMSAKRKLYFANKKLVKEGE